MISLKLQKAVELRKRGQSYTEISNKLMLSKRKVASICKNINFSKSGLKRYKSNVKGILKDIKKQNKELTIRKTRIIGHVLFDGALYKSGYHHVATYINSSYALINQFIDDMKNVYGLFPSSLEKEMGKQVPYYRIKYSSKRLYHDLLKYNWSYSTSTKGLKTPELIVEGSKALKLEFLRAFWEDEGSVSIKNRNKISGDLKSLEILQEIREMLKSLEIDTNISSYKKKGEIYYKLYLKINKKNIRTFKKLKLFDKGIAAKGENAGLKKSEILSRLEATIK